MAIQNVYSSFDEAEVCDVSSVDVDISVGGGVCKGLFLGTTGSVKVDLENGTTITFANVPAGFNPIACTKIYTAGTTVTNKATDIIAGSWGKQR